MSDGQILPVHFIGKDGLRMERIDEVDALIVAATSIECLLQLVGAVKDSKSRVGPQSCRA